MPTPHRKPAFAAGRPVGGTLLASQRHQFDTTPAIEMRRATPEEYNALAAALRQSAHGAAVRMDARDTTFRPVADGMSLEEYDRIVEAQVVDAIKATPCHYAIYLGV